MAEHGYNEIDASHLDPSFVVYREGRVLRWYCAQCDHYCEKPLRDGWLYGLTARGFKHDPRRSPILYCVCGVHHPDDAEPDARHSGCGCFFKYPAR